MNDIRGFLSYLNLIMSGVLALKFYSEGGTTTALVSALNLGAFWLLQWSSSLGKE